MSENNTSVEQFMMDLDFREWVINPTLETDQFWKAWMKSNPDKRRDLLLAKELIQKLEFNEVNPKQRSYDRVLQKTLVGKYTHHVQDNQRRLNHTDWKVYLRIAAVLIVVCFMYLFYTSFQPRSSEDLAVNLETVTKENSLGRKSQIYLPDGTIVWLNAQSKIEYTSKFEGESRLVQLTGEAYFDVAKDKSKPFIVQTSILSVTAIGTQFNVKAFYDDNEHQISLAEGKVMVKTVEEIHKTNTKTYLDPGQAVTILKSNGQIIKSEFIAKKVLSWKDGVIYFDDASLTEIIDVLQRWYGKKFIIKNVQRAGSWKFGSEFRDETLENVMRTISYAKNFEYKIEEDTVTIIF